MRRKVVKNRSALRIRLDQQLGHELAHDRRELPEVGGAERGALQPEEPEELRLRRRRPREPGPAGRAITNMP